MLRLVLAVVSSFGFSASAGTFTVLHTFSSPVLGTNQDGANPSSAMARLADVLCGTAARGGRYGAGTVFCLGPNGAEFSVLRSLTNSPDAGNPLAALAVSGDRFFGASFGGGGGGTGAIFSGLTNSTGPLVHSFGAIHADTGTNTSGASPGASVILSNGLLYGTACAGGRFANGVVFSVTTNGSTYSVLHAFSPLDPPTGTNADGASPFGGLVLSGDRLYGTTSAGGAGGNGTVFSLLTNGSGFITLHNFTAMDPVTGTNTDGALPMAGLVLSGATLYGAASAGGAGNGGTLFSIGTNGGNFSVLRHFEPLEAAAQTNSEGARPLATLTPVEDVFYGTASAGGSGASGTVFSVSPDGSQFRSLHHFTAVSPGSGTNVDGAIPVASLLPVEGALWGTTSSGGPGAAGTVFRLSLPVPAVITNIVVNTDGSVMLFFVGGPDSSNVVQAATLLAPAATWRNLSTNAADAVGRWQFTDTNTGPYPVQFYRSYAY